MDCNRCEDFKGTRKAEGWCGEDIEVVEANGWRRNDEGFEEGNFPQHSRLIFRPEAAFRFAASYMLGDWLALLKQRR